MAGANKVCKGSATLKCGKRGSLIGRVPCLIGRGDILRRHTAESAEVVVMRLVSGDGAVLARRNEERGKVDKAEAK